GIPTVVDRVVQQAIHQVLSPLFEKQFSEFSYGFRPKRSCEMAANRVMSTIVRFIEEKLGLIVNVEKSRISRPKELKFLGFGYY
ncbi:group II intron reverse transcriptase/maturase, partial [Peribacillus simplex]|nr:group II intron reverse transcriptase/maturase [Peribacillus simplex]